jgi:hypothetical protein
VVLAGGLGLIAPAPVRADEPAAPASDTARVHAGVRASGGVDFASLPAPAPGAEVAVVVLFGANRVELHGSAWVPQPATAASTPMAGGEISLLAAGLRYCRAFVQRTLEVGGCGGLEAGALLGRGFGVAAPVSGTAAWVAPVLGVLGLWNVSPSISFAFAMDGLVPVLREPLILTGLGALHRAPPATGRALLGLEARFR